jgi:glycosyltransferase involved in cell wall biosynthesis
VHRLGPTGAGQLKKWGLALTCLPALVRLRHEYDLVFVSGFRIVGATAVIAARVLGKRVVLKADSRGEMSGEFFAAGLARFGATRSAWGFRAFLALRNAVLRRADAFAAISDEVETELVDARVGTAAIHRIPNAVDTTRFFPAPPEAKREARRALGLPDTARVVVYTGRLVRYKGLPLLLRVWPRLLSRHPDAVLLLVGTGGLDIHACEDELRATVRAERLEPAVVFAGSVENVPEYLRASDVFAFPTENDAFPSSVIEAMATALPVVATPVGAIEEIVRDGHNGVLVEPRNETALLSALERVLADPPLAARLGHAAWRTAQDLYSAEGVTRRYLELFRAVSQERT